MTTPVQAFVLDRAFSDTVDPTFGILSEGTGKVATLTPNSLSYFDAASIAKDPRDPSSRSVNWTATTSPALMVDNTAYATFVTALNDTSVAQREALFDIIDQLGFDYKSNQSTADIEASFLANANIAAIYQPGSLSISSAGTAAPVYLSTGTQTVQVPNQIGFTINLTVGTVQSTWALTLYLANDTFIANYPISTIKVVIPPLDYNDLLNASLVSATNNIFATATLTAQLSYNTAQALLKASSVSGMAEYQVILVDSSNNTVTVPFNILYKGQNPTTVEIREAIADALANSGVGTLEEWQNRIPGIYTTGRYWLCPMWGETNVKEDQITFPNIFNIKRVLQIAQSVMTNLVVSDFATAVDVLTAAYDKITIIAMSDTSGQSPEADLMTLIPDYQEYSASEANFAYMAEFTRNFATTLNNMLAIAAGDNPSSTISPITENGMEYYSFTINSTEFCLVTKDTYTAKMGANQ